METWVFERVLQVARGESVEELQENINCKHKSFPTRPKVQKHDGLDS